MDSLYEHVHDDADLIQGNAGVTNSSSRLTEAMEERIASYEEHRTTSDMSSRLRGTNRTLDPLEYLPPELSTFVIAQALPPQENYPLPSIYPSRLIELTTVSKKWQSFLFSTPVLWSDLFIDERQEGFLAMLSVFIRLSSNAPLTLVLRSKPTGIDWTELAAILLPGVERVAHLHFGMVDDDDVGWVPNVISTLLQILCGLPGLKEVNFPAILNKRVSLPRIKSFGLPSTVNFNGLFRIELPENCRVSGTHSRFFDVTKRKTLGTLGRPVPPPQPNLLVEYLSFSKDAAIISNGSTLRELETLAECLTHCNCFEQVVHIATFTLHNLDVAIYLSQTEDLLDCIRMLMGLRFLSLHISRGDREITREHTLIDTTGRDLKSFGLVLDDGVENLVEAQKPLGDLFSALGILYPGVEKVRIHGSAFIGLEISYLQDLQALKSLVLGFAGSPLALPSGSITLQPVQYLEVRGVAPLDKLCTPSLLKLALHLGRDLAKFDHLGPFPRGLRSLEITFHRGAGDLILTSLDFPDLRDLYLRGPVPRASWGRLWLSNLVSIEVEFYSQSFTQPSSNQLCVALLCYPRRLPSLRELHFSKCVEWDLLFLLLKRRNCDESGVHRIDTVTLPFVPFAFHNLLTRLLAGEIVELPSLISISLEATREVMFDSSVPGCFACMKNMRPRCTERIEVLDRDYFIAPVDMLYPPEDPVPEELAREVQDWLSQRRDLVDTWKASYTEFVQRKKYVRYEHCRKWVA